MINICLGIKFRAVVYRRFMVLISYVNNGYNMTCFTVFITTVLKI